MDILVRVLCRHSLETKNIVTKYNEEHRMGNLKFDDKFMERTDIVKIKTKYKDVYEKVIRKEIDDRQIAEEDLDAISSLKIKSRFR